MNTKEAQPSGVVLPEPLKRGDEGGSGEYGGAMIRGYNACLREVARLNSSPVSAGGVDERAEITRLIGFEFEQGELQTVTGDELLRVYRAGRAALSAGSQGGGV